MLKNVASQVITALLLDTAGAAVTTGTTTVYVTGDGGTQASGGTATHEGQGVWSFLPSQANTNYDHVSFAFTNAGAVTTNIQVYTTSEYMKDMYELGQKNTIDNSGVDVSETQFKTDLTLTTDDALNGRGIIFKGDQTAALQYQGGTITSYNGTTKEITIASPLTVAPADNDTFVLI